MTKVTPKDIVSGFATRAVHAGQEPEEITGAIMTPIFQTSTYVQPKLGEHKGFEYARTRNPTRDALERNVAALEGGTSGHAFSSGLAATDAVLKLLQAGDHIICGENVYGGTHRLMSHIFERLGLNFTFVDTRRTEDVERACTPHTRMIFVETPTNPMMHITDLSAVATIARDRNIILAVDNTFASPCFQRPIEHGAEIVIHSTTKYLNGHSDMVGGIVVTNRDDIAERLEFIQNAAGAVPGPLDCWLALRGIKTLEVRMQRHDATGRMLAAWLSDHLAIKKIYYPGLPSHEQHELAARQMSGFGGMISLDVGSLAAARAVVEKTRIFALAESLGGVESLIGHPASMTHASVPKPMREKMGLTDGLVRLSVGIEDPEDLKNDLEQALGAASQVLAVAN
ncbi:MAG: cystathionine gamma-synthase [Gemmatimonadales bacterium]